MDKKTDFLCMLGDFLKEKHWQLACAESCTGGLLSSLVTDIPGSSLWFERGFVTYSNVSKEEMLSVPHTLIEQYGAVSEEVALAMALGALDNSHAHISVSITGIAGPEGGTVDKPVGTVCFGWALKNLQSQTSIQHFQGDRQSIRNSSCSYALDGLWYMLKNA